VLQNCISDLSSLAILLHVLVTSHKSIVRNSTTNTSSIEGVGGYIAWLLNQSEAQKACITSKGNELDQEKARNLTTAAQNDVIHKDLNRIIAELQPAADAAKEISRLLHEEQDTMAAVRKAADPDGLFDTSGNIIWVVKRVKQRLTQLTKETDVKIQGLETTVNLQSRIWRRVQP